MSTILSGKIHKTVRSKNTLEVRIRAAFEALVSTDEDDPIFVSDLRETVTNLSGEFSLEIPDEQNRRGPITLTALGPDGLIAGRTEIPPSGPFNNIVIEVEIDAPEPIPANPDITLGSQVKYTGRIIFPNGKGVPANLLVVLWGKEFAVTHAPTPVPISATHTAEEGYFSGIWPAEEYSQIYAVVSGSDPIPVLLEENRLPLRLILILENSIMFSKIKISQYFVTNL